MLSRALFALYLSLVLKVNVHTKYVSTVVYTSQSRGNSMQSDILPFYGVSLLYRLTMLSCLILYAVRSGQLDSVLNAVILRIGFRYNVDC